MTIEGKVYCLFEQSGTFKNEFIKLGIPAEDYDIQNNFGQTDFVVDLFYEIEKAYDGRFSILDNITKDDFVIAFFPCIFFGQQNTTFFDGTNTNYKGKSQEEKVKLILERSKNRQRLYEIALKMFYYFDSRGIRLVVENPYSSLHFLYNNFPYKPSLIDRNRQLRGDYFQKPTQYWFINCEHTNGMSLQVPKKSLKIKNLHGHTGNICDEDRSLISEDYARNFICDFILGKQQEYTQLDLFND